MVLAFLLYLSWMITPGRKNRFEEVMNRSFFAQLFPVWIGLAAVLIAQAGEPGPAYDRDAVLARLRDGNARFAASHSESGSVSAEKREELAVGGQHPLACIITCSDSRVPPEILFDQSLGDLFVIRLAGNVVSPEATASAEYAVEHLHVPVVVVLGHSNCGAVRAALDAGNHETAGPMGELLAYIRPALDAVKAKGFVEAEWYTATINENARRGAEELLRGSRVIDEAAQAGRVTVLSAVYDLHDGTVHWQMQLLAAVEPMKAAPAEPTNVQTDNKSTEQPEKAAEVKQAAKQSPKKRASETESYAKRHR
jgi:carbonic anhydrase